MGELAAIHQTGGLPRGRGSLDPEQVASAHRERIMRAAISAIAARGFADTRISDIVERAKVSRSAFYALFADKEQCFVAAHSYGVELILGWLGRWADEAADPDPRVQLENGVAAYLRLATEEPEFTRCVLIELPATGPAGLEARLSSHEQIAAVLKLWHESARRAEPSWPAVPESRYSAAVGAAYELLFATIARSGDPAALRESMRDTLMATLEIPRDDRRS